MTPSQVTQSSPSPTHIVWDWNGTLLDDFQAVLESTNAVLAEFGGGVLTVDDYRRQFTRPIRHFNELILDRPLSDEEWERAHMLFHTHYDIQAASAELAPGARACLERLAGAGVGQSLLSMWQQEPLIRRLDGFGIAGFFNQIDGERGVTDMTKAVRLGAHLAGLATPTSSVMLIGDSLDDAAAAQALGTAALLVGHGSCHLHQDLEATGYPVVEDLTAVARHIESLSSEAAA